MVEGAPRPYARRCGVAATKRKKVAKSREKANDASMINAALAIFRIAPGTLVAAFFIAAPEVRSMRPGRADVLAAVLAEPGGITTQRLAAKLASLLSQIQSNFWNHQDVRSGMGSDFATARQNCRPGASNSAFAIICAALFAFIFRTRQLSQTAWWANRRSCSWFMPVSCARNLPSAGRIHSSVVSDARENELGQIDHKWPELRIFLDERTELRFIHDARVLPRLAVALILAS